MLSIPGIRSPTCSCRPDTVRTIQDWNLHSPLGDTLHHIVHRQHNLLRSFQNMHPDRHLRGKQRKPCKVLDCVLTCICPLRTACTTQGWTRDNSFARSQDHSYCKVCNFPRHSQV
eukprot:2142790-Rhodomonas_salina.2